MGRKANKSSYLKGEKLMNKKVFFTIFVLISLIVLPFVANADSSPLDFALDFDVNSGAGGIISYGGGDNSLQGINITVDSVMATIGDADPFATLIISNGKLNFTSGGHTNGWNWGSGGTITITGGIHYLNLEIPDNTVLLSGSFNSANIEGAGDTFKVATSDFTDSKNEVLASYFGYGPNGWLGNFNISFEATGSEGNPFESTQIHSGGVNNTPVPIPPSVLLLAPGLAGLIAVRRRIKK
jgi:hypothetical protein